MFISYLAGPRGESWKIPEMMMTPGGVKLFVLTGLIFFKMHRSVILELQPQSTPKVGFIFFGRSINLTDTVPVADRLALKLFFRSSRFVWGCTNSIGFGLFSLLVIFHCIFLRMYEVHRKILEFVAGVVFFPPSAKRCFKTTLHSNLNLTFGSYRENGGLGQNLFVAGKVFFVFCGFIFWKPERFHSFFVKKQKLNKRKKIWSYIGNKLIWQNSFFRD